MVVILWPNKAEVNLINVNMTIEFFRSVVCSPPEYIMPGYKERPLVPLLPVNKDAISAVKNIAISSYNPPLGPRKIKARFFAIYFALIDFQFADLYDNKLCLRVIYCI